jgi:hypothetical protein
MEPTATATASAAVTTAIRQLSQQVGQNRQAFPWWPWAEGVGIPYLALFTLAVFQWRVFKTAREFFFELGIDACILGIGACGALFANDLARQRMGPHASTVALLTLFATFLITGLCLNLRAENLSRGRVSGSLFLGVLILAINTTVVFYYSQ